MDYQLVFLIYLDRIKVIFYNKTSKIYNLQRKCYIFIEIDINKDYTDMAYNRCVSHLNNANYNITR